MPCKGMRTLAQFLGQYPLWNWLIKLSRSITPIPFEVVDKFGTCTGPVGVSRERLVTHTASFSLLSLSNKIL